jgi:hypothetical protein
VWFRHATYEIKFCKLFFKNLFIEMKPSFLSSNHLTIIVNQSLFLIHFSFHFRYVFETARNCTVWVLHLLYSPSTYSPITFNVSHKSRNSSPFAADTYLNCGIKWAIKQYVKQTIPNDVTPNKVPTFFLYVYNCKEKSSFELLNIYYFCHIWKIKKNYV